MRFLFEIGSLLALEFVFWRSGRRDAFALAAMPLLITAISTIVTAQVGAHSTSKPASEITPQIERTFAAPREAVFHAWIDAEAIEKWFPYKAQVYWNSNLPMDARQGSSFSWSVVSDTGSDAFQFRGIYREIEPTERLVFTWEWDSLPIPGVEGPGHTIVSIEFQGEENETRIVLNQTGFHSEAAREAHRKGWQRCLDGIASSG